MMHRHNLDALNRTLRNLRRSTLPFGGIIMSCLGDFWQILPVMQTVNRSHIGNACFKRSRL